jgi:hypothetical protein
VQKESHLLVYLMTQMAMGVLSAVQCHEVAQAAVKDIQATKEGFVLPKLQLGFAFMAKQKFKLYFPF